MNMKCSNLEKKKNPSTLLNQLIFQTQHILLGLISDCPHGMSDGHTVIQYPLHVPTCTVLLNESYPWVLDVS